MCWGKGFNLGGMKINGGIHQWYLGIDELYWPYQKFKYRNEYGDNMWIFDNITGHRKLMDVNWEVKFIWDTGEDTWEPMNTIN